MNGSINKENFQFRTSRTLNDCLLFILISGLITLNGDFEVKRCDLSWKSAVTLLMTISRSDDFKPRLKISKGRGQLRNKCKSSAYNNTQSSENKYNIVTFTLRCCGDKMCCLKIFFNVWNDTTTSIWSNTVPYSHIVQCRQRHMQKQTRQMDK